MTELIQLSKVLKARGFQVAVCENKEQAVDKVRELIEGTDSIQSIGFGNSATARSMGLPELALSYTENVYIHAPGTSETTDKMALTADIYFTSANAVSLSGNIINIDATGNRTAAACYGPGHVVYVIGKNKITNTLEDAMARAKNTAVTLAKMYNRKTPCVVTGKCEDCISPECVCSVTTIHRKKPYGVNMTVILVNEDLGI